MNSNICLYVCYHADSAMSLVCVCHISERKLYVSKIFNIHQETELQESSTPDPTTVIK